MELNKYSACFFFVILFFTVCLQAFGQNFSISAHKKLRYLKKIEGKNERYVNQQEKKTKKLLTRLSKEEQAIYQSIDSTRGDSSFAKNSFSKLAEWFEERTPEELLPKLKEPVSVTASVSTAKISGNISADIKDYLGQQLLATSFLADSACGTCEKLKEQGVRAKASISRASEKLERLKKIEADIKKQQERLNNYGIKTPELKGKLKELNKSCYYYTQSATGLKEMYTSPAKGIESSLLKKLSFSKEFKVFQSQFNSLPFSSSGLNASALSGGLPDMTGYQTKAQVQAMLPQNAAGIPADAKAQLIQNMQSSLATVTELKNEKPDISMFKDKPDFKTNPYKGSPLRKRLVPGFTFQPQLKKMNEPLTLDLGATLGFKLLERFTPMIGIATKIGLGKDIQHLTFSYQGIVAKAGVDTKLAYGFSFQTWYEATWRPLPERLSEEKLPNYPEPSLIAGICNTYKISKNVKGTLLIGYDFFYNKHTPYTSPWVIRMGWQ